MTVNPHALADWAILTGRLPRNGRARFVQRFERDPAGTVAMVLSRRAARFPERPCPLFASPVRQTTRETSPAAQERRGDRDHIAEYAREAAFEVLRGLGYDVTSPDVRAAIDHALEDVYAEQRARRRAWSKASRDRKRAKRQQDTAAMQTRLLDELAHRYTQPARGEALTAHGARS